MKKITIPSLVLILFLSLFVYGVVTSDYPDMIGDTVKVDGHTYVIESATDVGGDVMVILVLED